MPLPLAWLGADPAVAAFITRDRNLGSLCHLIGDRHLVVPLDHERKFRKALLKLGYGIPEQHAGRAT